KYYPFTKFWYFEDKNTDGHPGFYLDGFILNDKEYRLDVRYSKKNEEFELFFYHKTEEIEHRETFILDNLDFNLDDIYRYCYKAVAYHQIDDELSKICVELNKLITP